MEIEPKDTSLALQLLRRKFEEIRLRNPSWSRRAFAKKIGVSSGALSEIMQGKRMLSLKARKRIIERLNLSPEEQTQLLADELAPLMARQGANPQYHEMDNDAFQLISEWWHFAILNLIKTKGFKPQLAWLASRTGVSREILKEAWARLVRLGFLEKNAKGEYRRKHPRLKTTDDVFSLSIRRAHIEDLRLIEKSIMDDPIELRECNSVTFAIRAKDLPKAKQKLRKLQDEFCEAIESDDGDEVYRMSIALFPLTVVKPDSSTQEQEKVKA